MQQALFTEATSAKTINDLTDLIFIKYKVTNNEKTVTKCKRNLLIYMTDFIEKLDPNSIPQTNEQVKAAVEFLKDKCIEKFGQYLKDKYGRDLLRDIKDQSEVTNNIISHPIQSKPKTKKIITLITDQEAKILIEQHKQQLKNNDTKTEFLHYLADSDILKRLCHLFIEVNSNRKILKAPTIYEAFFDEKQVKVLLNSYKHVKSKDSEQNTQNTQSKQGKQDGQTESDIIEIDLETGITIEQLPQVKERMKELLELKQETSNPKELDEINTELQQLNEAVKTLKTKLSQKVDDQKIERPKDDPYSQYLDLQIDPNQNPLNQHEIEINLNTSARIKEITLVDYHLPFNSNNINRLNNTLALHADNKLYRINIKPGNYTLEKILAYIKENIPILDINTNDKNHITIKHTANKQFDLIISRDSILPILGFTDRESNYKGKHLYIGNNDYDIEGNRHVFFNLIGTSVEPFELEFNKTVTLDRILKTYPNGLTLKRLAFSLTSASGQTYDFSLPFKVCLKITYTEEISKTSDKSQNKVNSSNNSNDKRIRR